MLTRKKAWWSLFCVVFLLSILLVACSKTIPTQVSITKPASPTQPTTVSLPTGITLTQPPVEQGITPTVSLEPTLIPSKIPVVSEPGLLPTSIQTPTPDTRLSAYYWRNWPIIPTLSSRALQVFEHGQQLGNDVHSFSRIGDCQSVPAIFLGIYDSDRYWLGPGYEHLQSTIDQFSGSFQRTNVTAKDGFGVASVLTSLTADPDLCMPTETPLECEYRLHKPIIAFIAMGTNWKPKGDITFERYLRQIIDFCIERGVLPVLVTKADNIEQDNLLNVSIARIAYEYDMPLYNAWAAVQYLPNHGLEENKIYLTTDAWNARNFAGLQVLDAIWTTLRTAPSQLPP